MAKLKPELKTILDKYGIDYRDHDACWEWTRSKDSYGYGHFAVAGKLRTAHRYIYSVAKNIELTRAVVVMHQCDNRGCVNPFHMRLGTQLDNIADRVAKGRNGAAYGERASTAKMTWTEVQWLRLEASSMSLAELAKRYGISKSQAARIVNYENWM